MVTAIPYHDADPTGKLCNDTVHLFDLEHWSTLNLMMIMMTSLLIINEPHVWLTCLMTSLIADNLRGPVVLAMD